MNAPTADVDPRTDRFVSPVRWLGYVEGVSMLVLLLVAMPLKHGLGRPAAVSVVGPIHGVLFLLYVGALAALFGARRLRWRPTLLGLVAAVVPLGPWLLEDRVFAPPAPGPSATGGADRDAGSVPG